MSDIEDDPQVSHMTDAQRDDSACPPSSSSHHGFDLDHVNDNYPDDNLSLEVNFGDGSSCRASDVSSLSFQNIALDDADSEVPYRADSASESSDSPIMYDEEAFPGAVEAELKRHREGGGAPLACAEDDGLAEEEEEEEEGGGGGNTGTMKRKHKLSSAPCTDPPSSQYPLPPSSPACGDGDCGGPNGCGTPDECPAVFQTDHSPASTLVNSRESSREPAEEPSKKRNSLEIRNNIPEMGEVKSCDNSMDSFSHLLHAAPQMKKKSPGLARRLMSPERETSSSEREEEAPKDHHTREEPSPSKESPQLDTVYQREVEELTDSLRNSPERQNGLPVAADIENEYDYVKYARIQQGDSYVGMRLAYSTSSECVEDSTSPNKPSLNEIRDQQRVAALEETLTEIPLNGNAEHEEERRNFSLSPEATECDSAEVESVLSEEGRSSTSGMPFVEDGLSSSQGSDAEDHAPVEQPAEILKQKRIQEIEEQRLKKALEDSVSEISSQASDLESEEHQPSQEQLDMAIRDIRNAIQRSRAMQLQNTEGNLQETDSVEPVWVMRDSYVRKQQRQEEMRRVRDEIERQQETDLRPADDVMPNEHGFEQEEDGDTLMKCQITSSDQPKALVTKGNEDFLPLRPKRYATVPVIPNDETQPRRINQGTMGSHPKYNATATQVDLSSTLSNSRYTSSPHSYDDDDSPEESDDPEARKPSAYIRQRTNADGDYDTDEETDELLDKQYTGREHSAEFADLSGSTLEDEDAPKCPPERKSRAREVALRDPDDETVLIEGVLFRAKYLGSTQLISEGHPSKSMRMMQAQEAVGRIKAPEGETQPSTDVDLFVSVEKIMILNTDLQEIMMDHSLRTISYIADIGSVLVVMARRGPVANPSPESLCKNTRQSKICCHVFESDEAQLIAQSIGQAFQVAYMEFLKANGIEDPGLMKEVDYQEVLNQQEIFGEELYLFSNKEMQKEVIAPKLKGEPLGVVIVESGWGSMVPTVVLANMNPAGAAARCGQLNIGDQIMSVNGVSLVGLPLSSCQNYIKATKNQTVVKLNVVSCPPVVEVLIKRPDVKYQLGFSVQNGVICSLLRGGIAERGGVRVGHRIIEINGQSVVAVPHDKIVSMLASSVGEITMKTMPTSIFRLLTGQDVPHYI